MAILVRKPNVELLARKRDVDGLVRAAGYRKVERTSTKTVRDLGIPVRVKAILALGRLGADSETVAAALRDPADRVRRTAVRVLYDRKEAGLLVRALRWLPAGKGQSRALVRRAVLALQESLAPAALAEALIQGENEELLNKEDEPLIQALLEEERAEETDEMISLLVSSLADERGIVAQRAEELLVRLGPASTDALVAELRSGPAAADAAYVLSRMANPETLDALVEALGHFDPRVRAGSAVALAELRDPVAIRPLLEAAGDTDQDVRTQAGLALDRLGAAALIVGVATALETEPRARRSNDWPRGLGSPPSAKTRPAA